MSVLATLLAATLLAAPAPAAGCRDARSPGLTLGPTSAGTEVHAFLDPAATITWRTFGELRRLVADHPGELRIAIHWVGPGGARRPQADRVRAWVAALARRGHATAALRLLARDGLERAHVRLVDPESHAALAQELGVKAALIAEALRDRCARRMVSEQTEQLRRHFDAERGAVLRLPAFMTGELVFDDGASLERLRPEVASEGLRRRRRERPPDPGAPPPVQATSDRMRRPPLQGLLLGGLGLRHRFVVMARDEDDPTLFVTLPPVLQQRREHPGELAVHIVSRGVSTGAEQLRHRLCAARELGLGRAYVEYLARDAMLRETLSPVDEHLLAALDEVPARRCQDEIDPVDLDLPDGAWLDGLPRSRSELGSLESTLLLLDAAARPLDWVLRSADDGP